MTVRSVTKDVEKLELSSIAEGNVKECRGFGKVKLYHMI